MQFYKYRFNTLFIQCPKVGISELKHEAIKEANFLIRRRQPYFLPASQNRYVSVTIINEYFHFPKSEAIFRIRHRYYNIHTMERIGYRLKIRYRYEKQHVPLGKLRMLNFKSSRREF